VTIGGALVVYAVVVGFAGPVGLRRAAWPLRAPRLGAAAVVAAAWSVPVALVLAGVTVFLPASGLTIDLGHLIGACLSRLHAAYGTPAGAGLATAGQVLTAGLLLRGAWTGARFVRRRRADRRRHRLLVRWAGAPVPELRAVVLEQPGAAAFAVGGAQRTVVVTRGIVDLLSGAELSAVLAHEHAHLAARHHRWLTAAAFVAQALPLVPLLRDAPAHVGRLLEMDADELAATHHEPRVIARALVAVASAAVPTSAVATSAPSLVGPGTGGVTDGRGRRATRPSGAGTGGAEALARVQRLLRPPAGLTAGCRALARAAIAALAVAPLLLAAAPMVFALT
jgi:Zn-dependent protease with chaperone function